MPPVGGKKKGWKKTIDKYMTWNFAKNVCVNPDYLAFVALPLLVLEMFINYFVIENVPYTEIDWKAYMQECEGFLNGTFDYSQLRGDTGPLVYPAGFVYIYSAFYYITNFGENVKLAQYMFMFVYLLQLSCVLNVYWKTSKVPPYVLVISILTSYRIHSIYILRLFNDPIAVLLFYISLNLFLNSKYTLGSVFFSLAVSVKMNILLFAPALLLFYLHSLTLEYALIQLLICAAVQLFLGAPFLISNPIAYIKGSFDLGRVFEHKWTVNYRFLDVELFEHKYFHIGLLVLHIILLVVFYPVANQFIKCYVRLKYMETKVHPQIENEKMDKMKRKIEKMKRKEERAKAKEDENLTPDQAKLLKQFESGMKKMAPNEKKVESKQSNPEEDDTAFDINFKKTNQLFVTPMFLANFIGILCARSLHYQFYSWYFHTLPYLLWCTPFSNMLRFLILALVELSWNTYPSTTFSSVLLHGCHLLTLWGIYANLKQASIAKSEKASR